MMREILDQVGKWFGAGEQVALATVVSTWGSSPRQAGSMMAISSAGGIAGSVSGGCVEGAVVEAALEILGGINPRLLHFGVSDEAAWDVGLACGGLIEVFVAPLSRENYRLILSGINKDERFFLTTLIAGPEAELGKMLVWSEDPPHEIGEFVAQTAQISLEHPLRVGSGEQAEERVWFINPFRPAPRLIIVGGVHIAIALASFAKQLGFETIIIDPRRLFASEERFPHVDRLIQRWPDLAMSELGLYSTTAVAVLTHDPKIDDPAIINALASPAFYVGVLGSRKTHAKRLERLRGEGVAEKALSRLHAPIGLDIKAQSPEEVALSIMAEIVAIRRSVIA